MTTQLTRIARGAGDALSKGLAKAGEDPFGMAASGGQNVGYEATTAAADAQIPDQPNAPPLPVMPTIDSEAVAQARKKQMLRMAKRGGRSSTILTGGSDTLGG